MTTRTYEHLEVRPDKSSKQLFIKGRGVSSFAIWLDRYIENVSPRQIAEDRDIH